MPSAAAGRSRDEGMHVAEGDSPLGADNQCKAVVGACDVTAHGASLQCCWPLPGRYSALRLVARQSSAANRGSRSRRGLAGDASAPLPDAASGAAQCRRCPTDGTT